MCLKEEEVSMLCTNRKSVVFKTCSLKNFKCDFGNTVFLRAQ